MTYDELINYFGRQSDVAEEAELTHGAVATWKRRGSVPPKIQIMLHEKTGGALEARIEDSFTLQQKRLLAFIEGNS